MSTSKNKPQSVDTSLDPGLEYLNQREIDILLTPTENSTKKVVYEEVTKVVNNIFQVGGPTGANGQLQFNQDGKYIGDAELQYDSNTDTLTTGKIVANSITITGNANTFKLPGGNNNDVLKTDGNGNLSWANVFPSVSGNTGKFLVTNGVSIDWSTSNYNSFASTTYVDSSIANLVGTAPAMLNTLAEIANVIGQTNDPQYGIISQLANKANISNLAQVAFSGSYADLSNRPTISTAGTTGNYSDLNGKPTIPASILDLGISDGSNGQVLTTYGNGKYHFTTVTSGSNANIGNINFDNNIIYSNTGVVINNSDLGNGQTAGMSIPVQGDGNTAALYNIYGNVTILTGNIGNSQPIQAWTFNPAGALFFPQTPYVTSAILVNDNNQELSISTDRGNISIWPENSKWLFGADGRLTLPGAGWIKDSIGRGYMMLNTMGNDESIVSLGSNSVDEMITSTIAIAPNYGIDLTSVRDVSIHAGYDEATFKRDAWLGAEAVWAEIRDQDAQIIAPGTRTWAGLLSYEAYPLLMQFMQNIPQGEIPPGSNMAQAASTAKAAYEQWQAEQAAIKVAVTAKDQTWTFGNDGNLILPSGGDIVRNGTSVLGASNPFNQDLNTNDNVRFANIQINTIRQGWNNFTKTTGYQTISDSTTTDIWIADSENITSAKFIVQFESVTGSPYYEDFDTLTCEIVMAKKRVAGVWTAAPITVYGIVHTSENPLVTFGSRIITTPGPDLGKAVLTCTPDASIMIASFLKVHSVEMQSATISYAQD